MSNTNYPTAGPDGTIPVNDAIDYAKNWRQYLVNAKPDFKGQSFLLPIVDFQNILKFNPDAEGVRAYIGLESADDPMSAKLILVPVVDGKDVLVVPVPTQEGDLGGDDQSNTYDVSMLCPPTCAPVGSPMNE